MENTILLKILHKYFGNSILKMCFFSYWKSIFKGIIQDLWYKDKYMLVSMEYNYVLENIN